MSPLITRAVAVDPDGGVRELDLGAGAVQMDALCRAIGSTLDMLTPQLLMWVDDEGVVNGSAVNTVATELVSETPQLRNQPASAAPLVLTGAANPEGGRDVAGHRNGCRSSCTPTVRPRVRAVTPRIGTQRLPPRRRFPVSGLGLEFGFSGPKCSRVSHALSVRKCVPGSENQTVGPLRASGYPRRPGPQPGRDRNPGPCWDAYHTFGCLSGVLALTLSRSARQCSDRVAWVLACGGNRPKIAGEPRRT